MTTLNFTFDTLKYSKRLTDAGLDARIAETEAEMLNETLSAALGNAKLATKYDLETAIKELKADAADQRTKIVQWLATLLIAQAAAIVTMIKLITPAVN